MLQVLTPAPVAVQRSGATATFAVRFAAHEGVRLRATVTPLRTARALTLMRGTSLAGIKLSSARAAATARVQRAGTYVFRPRMASKRLVLGRTYLVRITATDSNGRQQLLTIRVRA